jgi:flavin-dependent dehydrogenase
VVELTSRRAFLERSAAAAALLAVPAAGAAACGEEDDGRIVHVAIHRAIGVGRVGNSAEAIDFGPETPGALPRAPHGFKDGDGAVARQAARFRVYGLDAAGRPVRELTAGDADITWRVNVANAKPAWSAFDSPFDIPNAKPAPRRNNKVRGAAREGLFIVPAERSVRGAGARPVPLDGGAFLGQPVSLGEVMTDGAGRLVVLPSIGKGYRHGDAVLTSYAGDDGWADDVCDGVVRATVRLGRRRLEADPAWVLTTPPNYAPGMATGVVTLYDAVRSTFVDSGALAPPPVSFVDDILPLFARQSALQWVSRGYFERQGFGSGHNWLAAPEVERLADRSARGAAYRRAVYARFRSPSFVEPQPHAIPDIYGDDTSIPAHDVRQWLSVTPLQYTQLGAWAEGRFIDDRDAAAHALDGFADLPVAQQPASLDRAALESVLGGAFHPGIEAPWILRRRSTWERPWRLRVESTGVDEGVDAVDFMLDPFGPGWHLDRAAFDDNCSARLAGAACGCSTAFARAGCYTAARSGRSRSSAGTLRGRFVIDATGRTAAVARSLGARRRRLDRLVALVREYASARDDRDATTLVEATEAGWWYTTPLPGRRRIAAFLTDADLLPRGTELATPPYVSDAFDGYEPASPARTTDASVAHLDRVAGMGWLAAGDSAVAFDPLSSQGIVTALLLGREAGNAAAGPDRLPAYAAGCERVLAEHLAGCAAYYDLEDRWPDAPFWSRRVSRPARTAARP